jgi:hypothetical protein
MKNQNAAQIENQNIPAIAAQAPQLPAQPESALQHLCRLSQSLLDLAERESQALVHKDMLAFAVLQDEKEVLSHKYLGASQEFRRRLNEFRRVPKTALQRLEDLQVKLGERTDDNNALINQIRDQAERRTQDSLLLAQEYGMSGRSTFPSRISNDANTATDSQGA